MNILSTCTYIKEKGYEIILLLFLIVLGFFVVNRTRSDYRWSAWAIGDAQNLNASLHFSQEGFRKHYFLPYYHPGYIGQSCGSETSLGYYTHYPPLSAILNGVIAKIFGNDLFKFKFIAILFTLAGLFLWYEIVSILIEKSIALVSIILIGSSAGFLQFTDCVSPYGYSEFFVFGTLLFFLLSLKENNKSKILYLFLSWVFLLLESLNSFDYIFFCAIFIVGYKILFRREEPKVSRILFLLSAPFCGFFLHLLQNAVALGGIQQAINDLFNISTERLIHPLAPSWIDIRNLFKNTDLWFNIHYGLSWLKIMILACLSFMLNYFVRKTFNLVNFFKIILLLFVSTFFWWFVGVVAAGAFALQMSRQIFPAVSLLIASIVVFGLFLIFDKNYKPFYKILIVVLIFYVIRLPARNTKSYLKEYPNWVTNFRFWTVATSQDQMIEGIEISKLIKMNSSFGDIVMIPDEMVWMKYNHQSNPIFEYFSQRRMEYIGENEQDHKTRKKQINDYIQKQLPLILGEKPELNLFVLIKNESINPFHKKFLLNDSMNIVRLNEKWILVRIKSSEQKMKG